ncbi:MAG TPA: HEAT repeat domain-containing protein, partial [Methanotrichaceae archaeon]|nr:HEAT repeat domain-containing protein [Methanotrichaceae archaeon]
ESPAHILANVKEPETMQALDDTLSSPPLAKESNAPEGLSLEREGEKEREKLAAIEAIECMAATGNPEAKNLLFKHVQNEDFLVRHEAIRGILQYGRKEDRELLRQTLPAGDWYIMDIRHEDMRKVC